MRRAFLLAAIAGSLCAQIGVYPIAGVVVNVIGNAPVPRAHVYLLKTGTSIVLGNLVTGDDGKFRFDLPPGKYNLWGGPGTLPQEYGRAPDATVGSSIITGPGQDTAHFTLRWYPRAALGGKIVDENGDAVESALVQLIRWSVIGGRKTARTAAWSRSNDLGEYRFYDLPAGTYALTATAEPWYAKGGFFGGAESNAKPSAAYAAVHYPNTTDVARAAPLTLKPGEEARANFSLSSIPGATVTVHCQAKPGWHGTISFTGEGIAGVEAFQRQENFYAKGQSQISAVPPGHYLLKVTPAVGVEPLEASQPVDVGTGNLTVEVTLRQPPTVTGVVQFPDGVPHPRGTLLAGMSREDQPGASSAAVKADGSFTIPRLTAGRYRPGLALSVTGGYYAADIQAEGAPYRDGILDLADGQNVTLRITASDGVGRVQGIVKRADRPVEGVMVVLATRTPNSDPAYHRGFLTDSDGSFDFTGVRPGEYALFAAEDAQLEYQNPAAILPYLENAEVLRVEPHGVYSKDIVPVPPGPKK